ncbi:hypothetical protein OsJ_16983 [Oryza sativa Japonica Group]|uniref:Uncharacterized protein n=1 Tax=Oryza sativa subsp. japonica TaxID=39947 RepID=B9FGM4_ORYSJ|nr:hypothetical protein OsJ_16983 [Oryza sativa Japonica Group]
MVFGDYFRRRIAPLQDQARGAWEYTGPNDPMRTHVGERWDWGEEDMKTVIRRVLGLDTAEQTLIPDGILPLCSDRDRESILAVMSAVGASRGQSRRGGADGGVVGVGSGGAAAGGSRTSGPGGGGSSRAPGPSRGPGVDSASDPKGKRKMSESRPPPPPRGGGAERVADRPPAGHKRPAAPEAGRKKKRLWKIGQTEPCRGSFIEPPKWTFNRPPRSMIPSQGISGSDPSQGTKSERPERPGLGRSRAAGPSQHPGGAHGPHTGSALGSPQPGLDPPRAIAAATSLPGATPRPRSMRSATRERGPREVAARKPRLEAALSPRPRPKLGAGPSPSPRPNLPEGPKRGVRGTAAPPCTWGALGAGHAEGGLRAAPSLAGDPAALRRPGGEP